MELDKALQSIRTALGVFRAGNEVSGPMELYHRRTLFGAFEPHAEDILDAAERSMDLERMLWALIWCAWDRTAPLLSMVARVWTFHIGGVRFPCTDARYGLPGITPELRTVIDATEGSPYYGQHA